jgi:hypothetical protein
MLKLGWFQARYRRSTMCRIRGGGLIWLIWAVLSPYHDGSEQARAEPGGIELGVRVAPSLDTHAGERQFTENTYKQGWSAGVVLRYGLSEAWSMQTELLHATRGTNLKLEGEVVSRFNFRYLQVPLLARYARPIPGLTGDDGRPLLTGYAMIGPTPSILLRARDLDDNRVLPRSGVGDFEVTVTAGLGVAWRFTPRWAVSAEARFDRGFVDAFSTDIESKNQAILLALGIDYMLYRDDDRDDDSVADALDRCPAAAEDGKLPHAADGCPDADGDGVIDRDDGCPREAEDSDEFKDEDGCPDPDNDGDTIIDSEDKCPTEPFPYNKNLLHDQRGCPPKLDAVHVESGRLVLTPPLEFEKYGHTINEDPEGPHVNTLNQVVELLERYYPDMRLRLEGHADGEDDPRQKRDNQEESDRRARAVAEYLMRRGIHCERLVEKGFSNDRPIRREETDAGKRRNRRVELVIIEIVDQTELQEGSSCRSRPQP